MAFIKLKLELCLYILKNSVLIEYLHVLHTPEKQKQAISPFLSVCLLVTRTDRFLITTHKLASSPFCFCFIDVYESDEGYLKLS